VPKIPLGIGAYKRDNAFQPPVELYNLVLEKDDSGASPDGFMRVQRPGLAPYTTIATPVGGVFQQQGLLNDDALAVGGNSLYRISGGSPRLIGPISGSGIASFAPSISRVGLVRKPSAYIYDGTLADLPIPTGLDAIDIDQLNGYLILLAPTGRFYWLVPGETAIDPLDFANAESSPDGGVAVRRLVDELFFFNSTTTEVWQSTGDQDAPFARAPGRVYDKGCLNKDTVQRFDNALVWVGNDLKVYRTSQQAMDIGNPFISERLRLRTDEPSALTLKFDDHEVYVLRIPGQGSWAYDASTQEWSEWGTEGEAEWSPHVATFDISLLGDSATGKLWFADPGAPDDDGVPMVRRVTGTCAIPSRPVPSSNFSVGIGSNGDTTAKIRWKDGRDDWPAYYEEVEARAPYDVVNIHRTGMMREPFRTWEVMFDGPERVRISGAMFGEAWG